MTHTNDTVLISLKMTRAERDILRTLARSTDQNQSEYLRGLVRQDAVRRGVEWPAAALEDTRGQYPRPNRGAT